MSRWGPHYPGETSRPYFLLTPSCYKQGLPWFVVWDFPTPTGRFQVNQLPWGTWEDAEINMESNGQSYPNDKRKQETGPEGYLGKSILLAWQALSVPFSTAGKWFHT